MTGFLDLGFPEEEGLGRGELERLRGTLPANIRFGTSSWNYPGWKGLVYHRDYPTRGAAAKMLAEYGRFPLFGTVGIDSSFYRPPEPRTLAAYARALPPEFPCVSKVWDQITVHTHSGKRGGPAGQHNPDFLNAELFLREVYTPYREHFADHMGAFVFEFQTIAPSEDVSPQNFVDRLDRFFEVLPREARYAVEIRNAEFLTPAYLAVLRAHGVAHVLNSWTRMPPIGVQLELTGVITADFLVARALLRPGRTYEEAVELFAPYDRIKEPAPELREDLVALIDQSLKLRIPAYLLVNNRAEGSAPHTIAAVMRLAEETLRK